MQHQTVNPGGGDTPQYKLHRYVPPQRVWFLSCFDLTTGINLDHYGRKSGIVFKRTTRAYERICLFNYKSIVEKGQYPKFIILAEFSGEFYQFLTSALVRIVITLQARSENGYGF